MTVEDVFKNFAADANARGLRKSTLREYDLLRRTLTAFRQNPDVDQLRDFRSTWKLNARTTAKTLERLHSFFEFCLDSDWIERNPAKSIKAGKVEDVDVLPFSDEEVEKILAACDTFNGNGERIRALTVLALASGLRIGDASTISRDRFVKVGSDWKLMLLTAKTGVNIYIPLQKEVVQAIDDLPGKIRSDLGKARQKTVARYGRKRTGNSSSMPVSRGTPASFPAYFAKNLLVNEVPLETVNLLLGHKRLATGRNTTLGLLLSSRHSLRLKSKSMETYR